MDSHSASATPKISSKAGFVAGIDAGGTKGNLPK
jgi:hypothetical protein